MKLLFVSLGCDKNLVDTEFMLGMLRDDGIEITNDETEADIIIVNTCCFINDAKEESVNTILEMAEYKKTGPLKASAIVNRMSCTALQGRDQDRDPGGGCYTRNQFLRGYRKSCT